MHNSDYGSWSIHHNSLSMPCSYDMLSTHEGIIVDVPVGVLPACSSLLTSQSLQDEQMQSMMEDMKGKFKALAAMLGVLERYLPSQSTSATDTLSF